MELSEEEENFIKLTNIVLNVITKHLRDLFARKWNEKFPKNNWVDGIASGNVLYDKFPPQLKSNLQRFTIAMQEKIKGGISETWDATILCFLFLDAGLNLVKGIRPIIQRILPLRTSEHIASLREVRNTYFAHAAKMSYPVDEFTKIITDIKETSKSLFGAEATTVIEEIEKSSVKTQLSVALQQQLEQEIKLNDEYKVWKEQFKKELEDLNDRVAHLEQKEHRLQLEEPPIEKLKEKYRDLYKNHEIHYPEEGQIKMKRFKVDEFAVMVKVVGRRIASNSFEGEIARHLKSLNTDTGEDIQMNKLIDKDNRVTYIRGIAGIGKSVFAKQIIHGWACGSLYTEFSLCIMFECRDLNYFHSTKGKRLESHEIFEKFLKAKFDYNAADRDGVLFVVDGLDELYDVNEHDSVIYQLLDASGHFRKSKIIITGRPHVQGVVLRSDIEMGNLQVFEILGLSDKHIIEFIDKFTKCQDKEISSKYVEFINSTRKSSNRIRSIMSVPQFLNTLCCVAVLTEGKEIRSTTELYSWTFFLFLKQHIAEKESTKKHFISTVFSNYSPSLLLLSKISHELLKKNEIIFKKSSFQSIFDDFDKVDSQVQRNFFESLFIDVSDNFHEKYQFKHLSIMEFLSALHCFSESNLTDTIAVLLERRQYEVITYLCGFYGSVCEINGGMDSGIVHEIVTAIFGSTQYNGKFLVHLLSELAKSELDPNTKLLKGLEFIMEYLPEHCQNKELIQEIMQKIKSFSVKEFNPTSMDQLNLINLVKILKMCDMTDCDINSAFADTHVGSIFNVKKFEFLDLCKYFTYVEALFLTNKDISNREMEAIDKIFPHCMFVNFKYCRFTGDLRREMAEEVAANKNKGFVKESMVITKCKITEESIYMVSKWLKLSKGVELSDVRMNRECWEVLAKELHLLPEREPMLQWFTIRETRFNKENFAFVCRVLVMVKDVSLKGMKLDKSFLEDLVKAIEEAKEMGMLRMKYIMTDAFTLTHINLEIEKRIEQCGVDLYKDGYLVASNPKRLRQKGSAESQFVKF